MKKIFPLILFFTLLAACSLPKSGGGATATPTKAEAEMATQVAQALTARPTTTSTANNQTPVPQATATLAVSTPSPSPTVSGPSSSTPTATSQSASQGEQATTTPTSQPTLTPTITNTVVITGDPISWLGAPAWNDPMNDGKNWPIDSDAYSTGRIENGNLVIIGKQKMFAWRLTDVKLTYAYIEAKIKNDNCAVKDSYGIMFRVPVYKEADRGYLFGVTCDGDYFMYLWDGKAAQASRLTILVDYTSNVAINAGAGFTNRIGVMTSGNRLLFYVNGTFIQEVDDPTYPSGSFGIFVRPQENVPFTIRVDEVSYWTDLKIIPTPMSPSVVLTATTTPVPPPSGTPATITPTVAASTPMQTSSLGSFLKTPLPISGTSATPTLTATPGPSSTSQPTPTGTQVTPASPDDIVPKLGKSDWTDPMDNGNNWQLDTDKYTSAKVENGYLVLTGLQQISGWRLAGTQKLTDAYIEASIKADTCSGNDSYGLFFRAPSLSEADQGYLFGITCDGDYFVWSWDGKVSGKMTELVKLTANKAIKTGSGQINRIGVLTVSNQLQFYVNGVVLKQISDNTYPSGYIGIFVKPTKSGQFTIRMDVISYWTH